MTIEFPVRLFPSREQQLVLEAALTAGPRAVDSYRQWRSEFDLSKEFDRDVFRLVPLLFDNLHKLGFADDLTARLRGAYRMSWAKNHRLFEQTREIMESFANAGIAMMAVKGAPLALHYYENVAIRPMADVDLVVPRERVEEAFLLLQALGYRATADLNDDLLKFRHAAQFIAPDAREFDLHWHMLFDLNDDATDEIFWRRSAVFDLAGCKLLMPDASCMLLHTMIHGLRWNDETPIRWIPDSLAILRKSGSSVDWPWLVEFAEQRKITQRLHLALTFLQQKFAASVPLDVIDSLGRYAPSLIERVERHAIMQPVQFETLLGPLLSSLAEYPRRPQCRGLWRHMLDFTHFLRFHWNLQGRREIPRRLLNGVWRQSTGQRAAASR